MAQQSQTVETERDEKGRLTKIVRTTTTEKPGERTTVKKEFDPQRGVFFPKQVGETKKVERTKP